MDTLIKADIFFFITAVATVLLTVLLSILFYYLIRAGKSLHTIIETLKNNYSDSEDYILELKESMESNLIFRLFFPGFSKKKKGRSIKGKVDSIVE